MSELLNEYHFDRCSVSVHYRKYNEAKEHVREILRTKNGEKKILGFYFYLLEDCCLHGLDMRPILTTDYKHVLKAIDEMLFFLIQTETISNCTKEDEEDQEDQAE